MQMKGGRSQEIISFVRYFAESLKLEILMGENHYIYRARIAIIKFSRYMLAIGLLEINRY